MARYSRVREHPSYLCWQNMRARCHSPGDKEWARYGGRGIGIWDGWQGARDFLDWLDANLGARPSPCHTIDRIEGNGDYAPGNIRWADRTGQTWNRPQTIWVEVDGERMPLTVGGQRIGLTYKQAANLAAYLRRGIDLHAVLSKYQVDPSRIRLIHLPPKKGYRSTVA